MSLLLLGVSRPESSFVLDVVGVAAEAAYGLRKLRSAYAGSCIRIRESGANMETDIGFLANGDLDTAAIFTFCAGLWDGFIVTWYDQSGNGRDVTQATADNQPKIATAGVVPTIGTKPTSTYDGTNDTLARTAFTMVSQTVNAVCKANGLSGVRTIWRQNTTVETSLRYNANTYQYYRAPGGVPSGAGTPGTTNPHVITAVANTGSTTELWADGTSQWTFGSGFGATASTGAMSIGAAPVPAEFLNANLSEVLVFSANLTTTQRQAMERNQGTYFGITVA